jgi:F-box protein 9
MENTSLPSISETAEARLPSTLSEDENTEEAGNSTEELDNGKFSLWNQDGWELTWPIWHLLPRDERRRLAHHHGYKTIGEFEEYMSLHQAMDDSEYTKPYANERIYPKESADRTKSIPEADSKPLAVAIGENEEEEHDSDSDEKADYARHTSAVTDDLSYDELLQIGGQILMLHDEIVHQVFAWLPVDAYATLAMVSPHWKHLTRTEAVYRRLCERLYLNQSKRRQLHVSRFGGSYRTMLEERPRVRAAGGCYILKYAQVKQIQRDMWTEVSLSQK